MQQRLTVGVARIDVPARGQEFLDHGDIVSHDGFIQVVRPGQQQREKNQYGHRYL
jgi:hypothetical protein